jgi:hypothetical protein
MHTLNCINLQEKRKGKHSQRERGDFIVTIEQKWSSLKEGRGGGGKQTNDSPSSIRPQCSLTHPPYSSLSSGATWATSSQTIIRLGPSCVTQLAADRSERTFRRMMYCTDASAFQEAAESRKQLLPDTTLSNDNAFNCGDLFCSHLLLLWNLLRLLLPVIRPFLSTVLFFFLIVYSCRLSVGPYEQ